ncbi:UNVERIFIED_CONTAM: hypothetical protein Sradi_4023600 [Sesamum radiatum]|uniref:DDE Tnp4 domain-containing protein n=1 Tax=Sesamum radiatum TaxID=300843 RepID=A0AAW2PKZ1_SESRA
MGHIEVRISDSKKGRYRNRKGQTSLNILGVCNTEGLFTYVMSGWEGSVADGRVLLNAISIPTGLKVPTGIGFCSYSIIATLTCKVTTIFVIMDMLKAKGSLPRSVEYDSFERMGPRWCGPQTAHELFNLRHVAARNVIERSFGLLKTRWGILRSPSYYSIYVQNCIIITCCLLHNYVRREMPEDPFDSKIHEDQTTQIWKTRNISSIETTTAWTAWREELATNMSTTLQGQCINHGRSFQRGAKSLAKTMFPVAEIVHTPKSNCVQPDTHECYVPTAEWCPEFGYVGNDKAISEEIQVTYDPNVHSTISHMKSGSTSKKRKGLKVSDDDGLSNAMSTFCESADARLGEIMKKLFVDFLELEKRSAVFGAVGKILGIDMNDQILVFDRLVDNLKKMDLFFSLPEEAMVRMVGLMLNGKV